MNQSLWYRYGRTPTRCSPARPLRRCEDALSSRASFSTSSSSKRAFSEWTPDLAVTSTFGSRPGMGRDGRRPPSAGLPRRRLSDWRWVGRSCQVRHRRRCTRSWRQKGLAHGSRPWTRSGMSSRRAATGSNGCGLLDNCPANWITPCGTGRGPRA